MPNGYELLKEASDLIETYCNNNNCDDCKLRPICDILPLSLHETVGRIAENKEKIKWENNSERKN